MARITIETGNETKTVIELDRRGDVVEVKQERTDYSPRPVTSVIYRNPNYYCAGETAPTNSVRSEAAQATQADENRI